MLLAAALQADSFLAPMAVGGRAAGLSQASAVPRLPGGDLVGQTCWGENKQLKTKKLRE
ncbi:unnamed protein product [Scytosiphon promiscuus]